MYIAFIASEIILFVKMLNAIKLFVLIGVDKCRCPISTSVCHIGAACFKLKKRAPSSASAAEDMAAFITCAVFCVAPLFGENASCVERKNCPPPYVCFGLLKDDASLWMASTISLALYAKMALLFQVVWSRNCLVLNIVVIVGFAFSFANALRVVSTILSTALM